MPLGTWGKVRTYTLTTGGHRATALYKDYDGVTRPVERRGDSAAKATNALLEALRDRQRAAGDAEITAETKMSAVAKMYFAKLEASDKATRTKQDYRGAWDRYLERPLANLTVRQSGKVSVANRILASIRDNHGSGAAKMARAVLTGVYALTVRHDALDDNPVREIESLSTRSKGPKKKGRIHEANVSDVLGLFHSSEDAERWDLVDMQDVFSGLGCRIGELLALDWETSIDFEDGTVYFHGTVIRVKGVGLVVQPYTKSPAGMRHIRPPAWVMDILKQRCVESRSPWAFPSSTGTLRDPDNARKCIRRVVEGTPFEGLHPHDWRHYVARVLHEMGLTARQIADYLGHDKPSTSLDHYVDPIVIVGEEASAALSERPPAKPVG
ncbi:tyrosine-type recombinase/integrase [Amycolatopsis sp. NPDC059090]|uniref:tyrosine-type recombinase/integrase n=1 Tax=unclassified Amycolatopsis TaxID=2618356 RepID=UPI00366D4F29